MYTFGDNNTNKAYLRKTDVVPCVSIKRELPEVVKKDFFTCKPKFT